MTSRWPQALVVVLFATLAGATLVSVWSQAGWPQSHDNSGFMTITHIYARHLSWLDLMPIWSSIDESGLGSPLPLMYHKLFYLLAGGLALLTGSIKAADGMAIGLFLVGGAVGICLTTRELGASWLASIISGCSLITANYTITNWLVRGALAEFSGAMVVPWVFLYFVRMIRSGQIPIGLGVSLGLVWLSHSVLGFYTALILASTYLTLAAFRIAPWSVLNPRTAWRSIICFLALVGPYLVPLAVVGRAYDLSRFLTAYHATNQLVPPFAYLWDTRWRFGVTPYGLTYQLDPAMLLLAGIGLGALARYNVESKIGGRGLVQAALPFILVFLWSYFLQLQAAIPFYERFPGANYIQFPWRLLALMTPALIVTAVCLADMTLPRDGRSFILGGAVVWMVVGCGAFVPAQFPRVGVAPQLAGLTFSSFGEYDPRDAARPVNLWPQLTQRWNEAACSIDRLSSDEAPVVRFHTSCPTATVLPLPLYASPFHAIAGLESASARPCVALVDFPGVCGAVIPAAEATVSVVVPTIASFFRWSLRRAVSRESR